MEELSPVVLGYRTQAEEEISLRTGVSKEVFSDSRRTKEAVEARFRVWNLLYTRYGLRLTIIAKLYKKNHSTILHGIHRAVENMGESCG